MGEDKNPEMSGDSCSEEPPAEEEEDCPADTAAAAGEGCMIAVGHKVRSLLADSAAGVRKSLKMAGHPVCPEDPRRVQEGPMGQEDQRGREGCQLVAAAAGTYHRWKRQVQSC